MKTIVSFHVGKFEIGLPIHLIQEIVHFPEALTPVPNAPLHVLGIFNLRGMLIPILNIPELLGAINNEIDIKIKKFSFRRTKVERESEGNN